MTDRGVVPAVQTQAKLQQYAQPPPPFRGLLLKKEESLKNDSQKTPLLFKEGCRKAAGWFPKLYTGWNAFRSDQTPETANFTQKELFSVLAVFPASPNLRLFFENSAPLPKTSKMTESADQQTLTR